MLCFGTLASNSITPSCANKVFTEKSFLQIHKTSFFTCYIYCSWLLELYTDSVQQKFFGGSLGVSQLVFIN